MKNKVMDVIIEEDISMENSERESMQKIETEKEENKIKKKNSGETIEPESSKLEENIPKERFTQLEDTFMQNQSQQDGVEEEAENMDSNNNTNMDTNSETTDTNNNLLINKEESNPNNNIEPNKEKKKDVKKKEERIKEYKIIVLGDINVGKSSLINRFLTNSFNKTGTNEKIKPENNFKKIKIDDEIDVKLNIWDTKGEEQFNKKLTKHYYKDAYGALIVFDLTNKESFHKIKDWIQELKDNSPRDLVFCLLGNKADLENKREVSYEEAKNFADDNLYYEVSAKNGNNVALGFEQLVYNIIDKQNEEENSPDKVLRGKEGRKTTEINFSENINDIKAKNNKCC